MKRITTLFLALVMLCSLTACGGSDNNDTSDNGNSAPQEPAPSDEITFTEMVVVDNDECTIKITGIDDSSDYTLKAYLENKSTDKTYMFSVESAAINGVMCDPFFSTELAAGEKFNGYIVFYDDDELEENGITEYTDIELTFLVYDSDDWTTENAARETVHVYPYGEDKAVQYVREAQPSDNVIIDNDYVTVIVTGYEEDDTFDYTVNLFLVNKTDKRVLFAVEEAFINGFKDESVYATSVSAGKCAFSFMYWLDSTFEENNITEVETIEFNLRAFDYDNSMDEFANETIILNP